MDRWIRLLALTAMVVLAPLASRVQAQVRGVYPLGMSATGSGVTPPAGITYANAFLAYSRDALVGPDGEVVTTGQNSVFMDLNTITWVAPRPIASLGNARYSFSATLPFANNSLATDSAGALSGGGGFADAFVQPAILGWTIGHLALKTALGFLAPTGQYTAGANDNVGSGYWTLSVSSGQTLSLGASGGTVISAFEMYEFHGTQGGSQVHPGQTLDLDYSIMQRIGSRADVIVQFGIVGYGQWQTTATTGSSVTPADSASRYIVNALGAGANVQLPARLVSLGVRYFHEFADRSTYKGNSLQISFSVSF